MAWHASYPQVWYVAPDGAATNDGSIDAPWDIRTATELHPPTVGSVYYLRGGNYALGSSDLNFNQDHAVYRAYPGETPVLQVDTGNIKINADNVTLQGPGIMAGVNTSRVSAQSGSAPNDIPTNGLYPVGDNFTLKGWIIHDLKQQFVQSGADNVTMTDCHIFNTGWDAPDRGHGHCWYSHGNAGQVHHLNNCIFGQAFGDGLEFYGGSGDLKGLHITNLIEYSQNGSHVGGESGTAIDDVIFDQCVTWACSSNMGYNSGTKTTLTLTNNYWGLNNIVLTEGDWLSVTNTGNTFASSGAANVVKVYPCTTPGLVAHIAVICWLQSSSVSVDVSALNLTPGASYRLRQGYDPVNDVSVFVYDGSGHITVSFTGRTVAVPTGYGGGALVSVDARFGCWRLENA